jgi:hypothetical protein
VAHASNRNEKCVMRKWCRWCCFSWVASMYTYIYVCSAACQHCWQASNIYIFTSQLHASIAGEQDIYIYTYIYIFKYGCTNIYIYIYM